MESAVPETLLMYMHIPAFKSSVDELKRLCRDLIGKPDSTRGCCKFFNASQLVKKNKQASHLSWERLESWGESLRSFMQNLTHVAEFVIWRAHTRLLVQSNCGLVSVDSSQWRAEDRNEKPNEVIMTPCSEPLVLIGLPKHTAEHSGSCSISGYMAV